MHHEIECIWKEGMHFDGVVMDHIIPLDDIHPDGTPSAGPSPKRLLLLSLAGCTSMDVVSILHKMRVPLTGFRVKVIADGTETHPKVYTDVILQYIFRGDDLERYKDQLQKAISLSQEKYCGVTAMLSKAMTIKTEIHIEP